MKSLLLSALLLLTGASLFSLPGCEVHETDRVVYDHDHPDYDHHDNDHHDDDHHDDDHDVHADVHY